MALTWRRKTILAKIETQYGDDAEPTGMANALQVSNLSLRPFEGQQVQRNLETPYMGGQAEIQVGTHVAVEFDIEVAGSGTGGTAPKYGPLLRACAFAETLTAADAASTIAASPPTGVGGPTGTFTYTKTAAFSQGYDRLVTLLCTTGGASGTAAFTVSAPAVGNLPAHNATAQVMTDATPFALAGGATITPTVGTSFEVDDEYTIQLTAPKAVYAPISDRSTMEALSFYVNYDGNDHHFVGSRGSVALRATAQDLPHWHFMFIGLYVGPAANALPTVDFTGWQAGIVMSDANTPEFALHGYDAVMETFNFDVGNALAPRLLVGEESCQIGDRNWTGDFSFQAPALGTKDFFATAKASTLGTLAWQHGVAAGGIVRVTAPKVQVLQPTYANSEGDKMLQGRLKFVPNTGDDEGIITVK